MAVFTGYYALGTGVSNTGVFTEATTYTRPAVNFTGNALAGLSQAISQITGPTGPVGGVLTKGAIFDAVTGGNCLAYWDWTITTAVPANFLAVTANVIFNNYLAATLNMSLIGGAGTSGSTIDQGAQIGTFNGQPIIAGTKLGIQAGSLLAQAGIVINTPIAYGGNVSLTGAALFFESYLSGIIAAGTTQATATPLTASMNTIGTAAAGTGVNLPSSVNSAGLSIVITNNGANQLLVYPAQGTSDTINGVAATVGVAMHPGSTASFNCTLSGAWTVSSISPVVSTYNTNAATAGATLTAANITGAQHSVVLNMTGALGGAANAQLPTVAAMVLAMPTPAVGSSFILRVINTSSGAFAWTVTTNTGWTIGGTMSVAQNTWRDFNIKLNTLTTATIQTIGVGTFS